MSELTALEPFTTFTAIAVPLDIANCDTDQLMPARYLRIAVNDQRYPDFLLHDLRFNADGSSKHFVFDRTEFSGARIVVGDINFGCGSSREVAVYGLTANNIRSVIAPSFGDIFYNNCIKNGVLPVRLPADICAVLRSQLHDSPGSEIAIDLVARSVTGPDGTVFPFAIEQFDQHRLVNGLDDISLTMQYEPAIQAFLSRYKQAHRWAATADPKCSSG